MGISVGPVKMTPTVYERFITATRRGLPRTKASQYAGISYTTYCNWKWYSDDAIARDIQNEYRDFIRDVERAEAEFSMLQIDRINQHGQRSWTAAAWLLERRFPTEFGSQQKQSVEISGPNGGPIVTIDDERLKSLTTEELLALQKALSVLRGEGTSNDTTRGALVDRGQTIDVVPDSARSDPPAAGRNGTTLS